jgi:hypothetical protein
VRNIIRRLSTRPSGLKDYEGNEDLPVTGKRQPLHLLVVSGFFMIWAVFILRSMGGARLSPLGTPATNWTIVPAQIIDDDECGAVVE